MPCSTADEIRQLFANYVCGLQPGVQEPVRETLLIQDGYFCGRRFVLAGYQLVWFLEEQQIKLFSPTGELLYATSVESYVSTREPLRRAG